MRLRPFLLAASFLIVAAPGAARAADAPATAPATQPVDPKLRALIDQLGDADPAAREAATKAIHDLGRAALPALTDAAATDDPEVRSRVRRLIRQAERRLPPAAPPRTPMFASHSVSVSVGNGRRTVDVNDNGYRIKIRQDAAGIALDVTGLEDGKEVTESYAAKDADQLKRENPEAFALYDKYNAGGNGNAAVHFRFGGPAGAGGPGPQLPPGQAEALERLMKQVEQQMDQANAPPEQRQRMRDAIERMRRQEDGARPGRPAGDSPAGKPQPATRPAADQ
jgi:hypothetical protein